MIQRFLFDVLSSGLAAIQADLDLLDDVFNQYGLSAKELGEIKTWFKDNPPLVKHQYARTDDTFPLYSIVLSNEEETDLFIGNDGGLQVLDDDDPDRGVDVKSSIWQHTFHILCYSEHPDGTTYLYEVAKAIFLTADLADCGLHTAYFSGMDLSPATPYIPSHLFARIFAIRAQREFERKDRTTAIGKAYKVGGIHVDRTGSPSDVGNVKTLVKVVSEDDLDAEEGCGGPALRKAPHPVPGRVLARPGRDARADERRGQECSDSHSGPLPALTASSRRSRPRAPFRGR